MRASRIVTLWCVLAALSPAVSQGESLLRPLGAEPETLDPQRIADAYGAAIDRDLLVGLTTLGPSLQPVPGAAEGWEVSDDRKTWTFHLRHAGKWSDGKPVTAENFVYSFRRLVDPVTAAGDPSDLRDVVGFEEIQARREKDLSKFGVEAKGPYTLVVHLCRPRASLLFLLSDPQTMPVRQDIIEEHAKDWTKPATMIGNGPYVLKSWTPQSELVLSKNQSFYAADDVHIEQVRWINIADSKTALRKYRAGELNWVDLTGGEVDWARHHLSSELHIDAVNKLDVIFFNMKKGVLAGSLKLREALNLATDRETIVGKIDHRGAIAAYGVVPSVVTGYTGQSMGFKELSQADRVAAAVKLVKDEGYDPKHLLKLTASFPGDTATRSELLALRSMLRKVNVDLVLDAMEWQVFNDKVRQGDFELGVMSLYSPFDDAEPMLDSFRTDAGDLNSSGFGNAGFDNLLLQARDAPDLDTRRHLLESAERILVTEKPVIPLDFDVAARLVNPRIAGFVYHDLFPQSRYLSFKTPVKKDVSDSTAP